MQPPNDYDFSIMSQCPAFLEESSSFAVPIGQHTTVMTSLVGLLRHCDMVHQHVPHKHKVKFMILTRQHRVRVIARMYKTQQRAAMYVIEFQRRSGCVCLFGQRIQLIGKLLHLRPLGPHIVGLNGPLHDLCHDSIMPKPWRWSPSPSECMDLLASDDDAFLRMGLVALMDQLSSRQSHGVVWEAAAVIAAWRALTSHHEDVVFLGTRLISLIQKCGSCGLVRAMSHQLEPLAFWKKAAK